MCITLIFNKQLTINKCTLLYCTNTEILLYCKHRQYTIWFIITHTHSFGTDTRMTFPPPGWDVLKCVIIAAINFVHVGSEMGLHRLV